MLRRLCGFALLRGSRIARQAQQHNRPAAKDRADVHRAVVELNERFCNSKPKSRPLVTLRKLALDLLEGAAKARQRRFRDANARIRNGDADPAAARPRADTTRMASLRKGSRSICSGSSRMRPASIFDMSRTSLMTSRRYWPLW